ncbi:MAG TPA: AtpZ/AtpI family protein [Gemmatimonadaceae bacterium]|jgi:ATP synthase protein I
MHGGEQDPATGRPGGPGKTSGIANGGELAGIGLQFAFAIFAFTAFGVWLDRRLGTSPWFTIVLVFVGAAGGFFSMYRKVMAVQRRDSERRDAARRGETKR